MKKGFIKKLVFLVIVFGTVTVYSIGAAPSGTLTQAAMRLDDPRMPPDRFDNSGRITEYWLGTQAPELPADQISVFQTSPALKALSIDGKRINIPDYQKCNIFLAPGNHTFVFSYYAREVMPRRNYMGLDSGEKDTVNISHPNVRMEITMIPGQLYTIEHSVRDATFEGSNAGSKLGLGTNTYSTSLSVQEKNISLYTPPALQIDGYLEPSDPSLPFEKQAFLEAGGDVYVIVFNGETVRWNGTIGIPEGSHTLQIEKTGIPTVTMTINCLPGHRYVLSYAENTIPSKKILSETIEKSIIATDVTGGMGNPIKAVADIDEGSGMYELFGYNYTLGMPLGFSVGFGMPYLSLYYIDAAITSWNFIVADEEKSGFEWTYGFLFPLFKYFSFEIAAGANHTKMKSNNEWNHTFVMEAGGIINFSIFYLMGTYRLSDFKKSGFAVSAGIRYE